MLHETIQQGLSEVPAGINVILVSRQDPPEIYARMRVNRALERIDWNELKFNFDESKRMIHHLGYKRLPKDLYQTLYERTEGWAAGLVLLTEGLKVTGADSLLSGTKFTDGIYRYFGGEIFNQASQETQDFLLKTSFFKRMTLPDG